MNSSAIRSFVLCGLGLCLAAWGFPVHRHVNRSATEALPEPLRGWMMTEVEWLSAHATDADMRKHSVEREAPRHYLDRDAPALSCLDTLGPAPRFGRAAAACSEDTLWAYGVLPWQIAWTYARLVAAMDSGDRPGILRAAADLGHYVADAHVPLHTTLNYNGQLSGQEGIHALWETRLPDLYVGEYDLAVEPPGYVPDVASWAWETVMRSHGEVQLVLDAERRVTAQWTGDALVREERNGTMALQRVEPWCRAYHEALGGMVERQWCSAIRGVSGLWYSAWIDAGQPDLGAVLGAREPWRPGWWSRRKARSGDADRRVP